MIFQFQLGAAARLAPQWFAVPFNGVCTVKVLRISYLHDNAAALIPNFMRTASQVLPRPQNFIFFLNSIDNYYDDFVIRDAVIGGQIDLMIQDSDGAIPAAGGGRYIGLLVTVDIDYQN